MPTSAPTHTGAMRERQVARGRSETSTSNGYRNAAIWATRFLTTLIARSLLALIGEVDAGDVLDRVAGDRDDHEAGERLR